MTEEHKQKLFANFGAVIVKLKAAAGSNQPVTLTADEVQSFEQISKIGFDNILPRPPQDDDWSIFEADEQTAPPLAPLPQSSPLLNPIIFPEIDSTRYETVFDFVTGKTLEEFKANVNRMNADAQVLEFTGEIRRKRDLYYAPVFVTRKVEK